MSEQINPDKLLTRQDVMDVLQCSARTVRRLEVSGKLPRVQLTKKHIRYRYRDLCKLIDKSVVKQAAW